MFLLKCFSGGCGVEDGVAARHHEPSSVTAAEHQRLASTTNNPIGVNRGKVGAHPPSSRELLQKDLTKANSELHALHSWLKVADEEMIEDAMPLVAHKLQGLSTTSQTAPDSRLPLTSSVLKTPHPTELRPCSGVCTPLDSSTACTNNVTDSVITSVAPLPHHKFSCATPPRLYHTASLPSPHKLPAAYRLVPQPPLQDQSSPLNYVSGDFDGWLHPDGSAPEPESAGSEPDDTVERLVPVCQAAGLYTTRSTPQSRDSTPGRANLSAEARQRYPFVQYTSQASPDRTVGLLLSQQHIQDGVKGAARQSLLSCYDLTDYLQQSPLLLDDSANDLPLTSIRILPQKPLGTISLRSASLPLGMDTPPITGRSLYSTARSLHCSNLSDSSSTFCSASGSTDSACGSSPGQKRLSTSRPLSSARSLLPSFTAAYAQPAPQTGIAGSRATSSLCSVHGSRSNSGTDNMVSSRAVGATATCVAEQQHDRSLPPRSAQQLRSLPSAAVALPALSRSLEDPVSAATCVDVLCGEEAPHNKSILFTTPEQSPVPEGRKPFANIPPLSHVFTAAADNEEGCSPFMSPKAVH